MYLKCISVHIPKTYLCYYIKILYILNTTEHKRRLTHIYLYFLLIIHAAYNDTIVIYFIIIIISFILVKKVQVTAISDPTLSSTVMFWRALSCLLTRTIPSCFLWRNCDTRQHNSENRGHGTVKVWRMPRSRKSRWTKEMLLFAG